jgi:hypothetical protein
MATLTATAYDPTYGAVTVSKVTARAFTHAVIRVANDGHVTASFHMTRDNADRAAGRPAPAVVIGGRVVVPGITRHVVPVTPATELPTSGAAAAGLTELHAGNDITDMIRDNLNRGVMVAWINADLLNRADCDVRRSVVLYDADRVFVMALGTSVTPEIFRDRMPLVADSMARAGVRYWSVGIA